MLIRMLDLSFARICSRFTRASPFRFQTNSSSLWGRSPMSIAVGVDSSGPRADGVNSALWESDEVMKALPVILGFIAGIIVTMAACSYLNSAREGLRQVHLLSDVHGPLRQSLDDIAQTQERGDAALAQQKVQLLQRRWSEYLDGGGRPPEQFAAEVRDLVPPTTRSSH